MSSKQQVFRHELKFLINEAEKDQLRQRFQHVLGMDDHARRGDYTIRSLYFEDYWQSAYAEKEAGVLMRKKYRIRIYNYGSEVIKLERKKKFGSYILKESAPLTKEEVEAILAGQYDFLLTSPHPLCREFYYECRSQVMRPRLIVDYERELWVYDLGTVRLTFDKELRAAVGSFDLFDASLPTMPLLEDGQLVLEVKYTEYLPQIIKQILPGRTAEQLAISKYVLAYEKTRYLHGVDYWQERGL